MISREVENNTGGNTTILSQQSTSATSSSQGNTNYLSSNTSAAGDSRRSVRLSAKLTKRTSLSSIQSSIHRTISGGVTNPHSPKLNVRKRASASTDTQGVSTTSNSISYSTIISNDDDGAHDNNHKSNVSHQDLLPSDQSDDEEMLIDNNTIIKEKTTGLASRSEVLSYFIVQDDGYKCKLCNNVYQCHKKSDANLRKHLASSLHQISNVLYASQMNDDSNIHPPIISSERKRELHTAAVNCILRDGLAFGVFRQSGMKEFLQLAVPGYIGPHRKTVRRKIAEIYSSYTTKLRSVLSKVDFIALTCDLWRSSKRIHYISLTGHVFTKKYETVPIVLGCRRVIGRHLSTTIERYIQFELQRLNIRQEQLISITTDNGSEMKKAASTLKFGNRISCMAHNLNLVVKHGVCLWQEPNPDNFPLDLNSNPDDWEDIDDIDYGASDVDENVIEAAADFLSDEDKDDNNDDANEGGGRSRNVTTDDEFESDSDSDISLSSLTINDNNLSSIDHYELLVSVFNLMKKTRAGVKFIRNHNDTNEYVIKHIELKNKAQKENIGGLVLDMVIRWNSSHLLLCRLLSHKDIVKSVFSFPNNFNGLTDKQKKKLHKLTLKQNEWDLLVYLRDVLQPFQQSTTALSGQYYPTMASSFIIWRLLSYFLNSTSNDEPVALALKESLRFQFNIYCGSKLPAGQLETMRIAAFLDPTTYELLDDDDRKIAKKLIFKKLKTSPNTSIILLQSSTQPTANKSNSLYELAVLCGHSLSVPSSTISKRVMTLDEEISGYIQAAQSVTSFENFWSSHEKSLPRLARLVRQTNISPASSVASEALFSVASFLNRKQRSGLSSRTLRYLLVLKNRHLLDTIEQSY
ncbi:unnamed protein product [Rotaria sp. Silwood2]|nr:unnamed protein product [Rotaria sp. Silwood2]